MASKRIVEREKRAVAVEAAIAAHGDQVGEALTGLLAPFFAAGETPVDAASLLSAIGRLLADRRRALVDGDEAHLAELADDGAPRWRRDEAAGELAARVVDLRRAFVGLYGRGAERTLLGLEGPTARAHHPVALARQGRRILERLSDPGAAPPEPPYATVDFGRWAAELKPPLEALESALDEVARELRRAETTKAARERAADEFDRVYRAVVGAVEALSRLAGFDGYAERLRPDG
jgi:hypothetical protein